MSESLRERRSSAGGGKHHTETNGGKQTAGRQLCVLCFTLLQAWWLHQICTSLSQKPSLLLPPALPPTFNILTLHVCSAHRRRPPSLSSPGGAADSPPPHPPSSRLAEVAHKLNTERKCVGGVHAHAWLLLAPPPPSSPPPALDLLHPLLRPSCYQ